MNCIWIKNLFLFNFLNYQPKSIYSHKYYYYYMLREYMKTEVDVIDLDDIRNRIDNTYNVKLEIINPLKLNDGEIINMRVYYTVPRKDGEDSSTPHIHFITDLAARLLADMVRSRKCSIGRF